MKTREELIKFAQQFYADKETCIKNVDTYLATQPQKPDKELFEKVYIRSEEDLPKENGMYICMIQDIKQPALLRYDIESKGKYGYTNQWMKLVDWYLRPLE